MYRAEFELETITPLFMRGADQRKAEFRSASVKGVMRWWFRALAGNYFGNDIEALKKAECRIFGCAGTGRSRVIVDANIVRGKKEIVRKVAEGWWDKNIIVWSEYVDYFFFSVLDKRKNKETNKIDIKSRFEFYAPQESTFKVLISSNDKDLLKLAEASFWLAVNLGGFGFRARRGAGSLSITSVTGDVNFNYSFDNLDSFGSEITDVIGDSIDVLESKFRKEDRSNDDGIPKYPQIEDSHFAVLTKKKWSSNDWIKALDNFGKWYLGEKKGRKFVGGFRFKYADYGLSHTLEDIKDNKQAKLKSEYERRYYLGLPIRYANYNVTVEGLNGTSPPKNSKELRERKVDRRASGYWLSLMRIGEILYPILTVFAYQLYPDYNGIFYFTKKRRKNLIASGIIKLDNENNNMAVRFYQENLIDQLAKNSDFWSWIPEKLNKNNPSTQEVSQ